MVVARDVQDRPRISGAYERIALELAERREEICDENEGPHPRARRDRGAPRARGEEPARRHQGPLHAHGAQRRPTRRSAERLAIVAAEADRLQAIVDGFLSFSRGLDDLDVAPTKPYALARELSVLLETRAADARRDARGEGSAELVLNADGRKLRQALLNLVLNAMQASPRGETVTHRDREVLRGGAA